MNLFKKVIATIALSTMLIANVASVSAYSTSSVDAANTLAGLGIINDHSSDTDAYNLGQNVLRQEIAAVTMGVAGDLTKKSTCENEFDDVSATTPNTWACLVVETLRDAGMIAANANFNPESNITKAEALGMLIKAAFKDAYSYDSSLSSSWQEQLVSFASDNGVVEAFTDYDTPATRGWVFGVAVDSMDSAQDDGGDLLGDLLGGLDDGGDTTDGDTTGGDTTGATSSNLMVELSPETPVGQDIPKTAQSVVYTAFDVTAGSEDATITSVTVERNGLGSRTNFDKVWIAKEGVIISNDKTINSTDTAIIPMNYTVKAGETVTLQVVASMDPTLTTYVSNNLNVVEIVSSVAVDGAPIIGNTMKTMDYSVAGLLYTPKGSATTIDVGTEGEVIGEFKLQENVTASKKDVILKSIRLKANGGVDVTNDLENIELSLDGTVVSTSTLLDGDYMTFVLDDLVIEDGKSGNFEVKADIVSGDDNDTLALQLKDNFDLSALEEGTNFGVVVDTTPGRVLSTYTLDSGKVTLSQDTSNPASEDYVNDTDDVEVMVVKVDTDQDVTVDTIRVFIDSGSSAITKAQFQSYYENFRLYRNDVLIDSTDVVVDPTADGISTAGVTDGEDYLEFDASVTLSDNDILTLVTDITNVAPVGILRTKMNNVGTSAGTSDSLLTVEYASDGQTLLSTKLSGTASSNSVEVVSASAGVSIVRNDGYSVGETFLAGEQDAVLMKGVINAGNSSSLEVRKMNFDFDLDVDVAAPVSNYYDFTNLKLMIDGVQAGSTEDLRAGGIDGTVTFDGIQNVIPRNGQASFELVTSIDTSTVNDTIAITFDETDSVFYDENDNSLTIPTGDVTSPNLALATNALLTLAIDGNTPDQAIVIASTNDVEVAKYKFTATDGDVRFRDIYFTTPGAATDSRIQNLKLSVNGTVVDSRVPSAGQVHFILNNDDLLVPKDDDVVITVLADFNNISDDTQTNQTLILEITDIVADTAATSKALTQIENAEVLAGADVNTVVNIDTGDHYTTSEIVVDGVNTTLASDAMYIRKTQPTLATQDTGSSVLLNGEQTIYKVSVTADSAEDVDVASITFNVNGKIATVAADATDANITNERLFVNGVEVLPADYVLTAAAGGFTFDFVATKDEVVSAGTSKTFELKATLSNVVTDDYLSTKIVEDAALTAGNHAAIAGENFIWSDNSGSPHTRTTTDWFNGYFVNGLDTTTTTLTN